MRLALRYLESIFLHISTFEASLILFHFVSQSAKQPPFLTSDYHTPPPGREVKYFYIKADLRRFTLYKFALGDRYINRI